MTKFYYSRLLIILTLVVFVSAWSVAQAQTQPSPADDSSGQTLMQDAESPKADSLSSSSAAPASLESDSASAPNAAPPSLSEYLNKAGVGQAGANTAAAPAGDTAPADDTGTVAIPTMDFGALQGGQGAQGGMPPVPHEDSPEVAKEKAKASIRKDAFSSATQQMMPLKPGEIRRMLELYDETKQASDTPVYPTPEPESSFQTISLDPGAKPLVVKTAMGNVTTLSIVDITGQPWPIQDLTWAGDFQIEQPENGSHMLRVIPTTEFATGNISMRMVGLNPPVIFTLKAERRSVHVRLDVQIPEVGPKGVLPPMEAQVTTKAGNEFMTSVLVGVVKGANTEQLKVDGIDGRTTAYVQGDMMYVRTPYTMLSPAWSQSVQSGDGTKVYALNYTPVVLLSDKGKMVRAYLSHKEKSNEQY